MMDKKNAGFWRIQKSWSVLLVAIIVALMQAQMTSRFESTPLSDVTDTDLQEAIRGYECSYIATLRSDADRRDGELYVGYTEQRLKKNDANSAALFNTMSDAKVNSSFVFEQGDGVILRRDYYPLANAKIVDRYYTRETDDKGLVCKIRQVRQKEESLSVFYGLRSYYHSLHAIVFETIQ